jgi:predicted PhzF superfamily epimerase YddE/YHI9
MYDFLSRYFAPWVGIPEDPVTGNLRCVLLWLIAGSAHTVLGVYWSKKLNKTRMFARQVSHSSSKKSNSVGKRERR